MNSPSSYILIPTDVWVCATDSVGKSRTQDGEYCTVEVRSPSQKSVGIGWVGRTKCATLDWSALDPGDCTVYGVQQPFLQSCNMQAVISSLYRQRC